jgi:hypothetical protein
MAERDFKMGVVSIAALFSEFTKTRRRCCGQKKSSAVANIPID